MKTGRRSRQIIARDQPRDFPESLRQHLYRGRRAALGRWGGWGLVRYLAAPEATPQIGSDGEELARRRYLYGFPPVLEWGNGRCVVTGEISPGNRPSACQVGLVLRPDNSKGSEYRGGMNITESFVGSGGLAVTEESAGNVAPLFMRFPASVPQAFEALRAEEVGGGVSSENRARARACEPGSRPSDRAAFRALAQICLFNPSPIFFSPDLCALPTESSPRRTRASSSLPSPPTAPQAVRGATCVRFSLAGIATFFSGLRVLDKITNLQQSALGRLTPFRAVF